MQKITIFLVILALSEQTLSKEADSCASKLNCRDCVQSENSCAWCFQPNFQAPRCFKSGLNVNKCEQKFIQDLKNVEKATKDEKFSGGKGKGKDQTVQMEPQRFSLKLRVGQEHKLKFKYTPSDYALDLYYIMDLSHSMHTHKKNLSDLGDELAGTLKKITSNFQIGFGSFVDKPLMPFISTPFVEEVCSSRKDSCVPTYAFKNHLSLTKSDKLFAQKVKEADLSTNTDGPEGSLDAIMQAMVCQEKIGWRDNARHLLIVSTIAPFHVAGDGLLGGIHTRNDGQCHLDENGYYTDAIKYDYPSIPQLNLKAIENKINIIFVTSNYYKSIYETLARHIEGAHRAILEEKDSKNIINLVKNEYNKLLSTTQMSDNFTSPLQVSYKVKCPKEENTKVGKTCGELKTGDKMNFEVSINLTSCPLDPKKWKQTFQIYQVGINEKLLIDLEMLCDCPCSSKDHSSYKEKSEHCSGSGTIKCGLCECDEKFTGETCECTADTEKKGVNKCRPDTSTNNDCNGNGECICGQCECKKSNIPEQIFSGKFCECDNLSCARNNDLLCSGKDHGTCDCGVCVCKPPWSGYACECRDSTDTCIEAGSDEVCSGHGTCHCGTCQCEENDKGRYYGKFCENSANNFEMCNKLEDCVKCKVLTGGQCQSNCTSYIFTKVDAFDENTLDNAKECNFFDANECRHKFVFLSYENDKTHIFAMSTKECPQEIALTAIVIGILAGILFLGILAFIIWKIVTYLQDKREYQKFQEELMNPKWGGGDNPIYNRPRRTFYNPIYGKKD